MSEWYDQSASKSAHEEILDIGTRRIEQPAVYDAKAYGGEALSIGRSRAAIGALPMMANLMLGAAGNTDEGKHSWLDRFPGSRERYK